ncbi:XRE family transcriptional regulator [Aliidiomarina sanyensis]|uniref:Transcriptional regulator n=1 Tax=Aliidiomarina sanyensis TaxID=1249555 RepID=A0A432WET6_9GAMM|nr:XRE family transcriptional regulator [Aliidiomarina sanyensis]RUO31407.1 transcriptional regulator [Aliidiomarina sanyensis]
MDKNQLKKELALRGYDFSMLAEALDRSPSLISKVASRQATSRFVADAFAKIIGKPVAEVFPDVPEYQKPAKTTSEQRLQKKDELKKLLD